MARSIREELKRSFDQKGWTYKEAAKRLGISYTSAYRKLNGLQLIEIGSELDLFARVFDVKVQVKGAA